MTLAGIFVNYEFRESKGIIESLFNELNIKVEFIQEDSKEFLPIQRLLIKYNSRTIGQFGVLEQGNYVYYEFDLEILKAVSSLFSTFKPIPKYPSQIEDITLSLPSRTKVGEMIAAISSISKFLTNVELSDIYKDKHTFRIWYQHPDKTLTDSEVQELRNKILKEVKNKFGATLTA
jgi:phenylalanyl-tRNA synthetase beta chain